MDFVKNLLKNHEFIFVFIIFSFAFFIRVFNLLNIPYGFHMDELANTYIGRFIVMNGKDLYGNPWPLLYFNKFGDYPPVIPMYLSGFSSFVFGLNEFSARFPSALIGSLIVFPLFYFMKMNVSKKAGVIAAFLITILPWHVVLSRSSAEGIIALTVFMTGLTFLFKAIYEKKNAFFVYSSLLLISTYVLYPSFRLSVPLILLGTPFFFAENKVVKKGIYYVVIAAILFTFLIASTSWGKGRFIQTSLFSNRTDAIVIQNDLLQLANDEGHQSALIARTFHNKAIGYGERLIEQYVTYFSPGFLLIKGGLPERYSIPHLGLLYITSIFFLGFLLFPLKVSMNKNIYGYMYFFLFVVVVPSAITVDDMPNMHRSLLMIIPLVFLLTIGILNAEKILSAYSSLIRKGYWMFIIGILCVEVVYGTHQYYSHAGALNAFLRTDGNKQLALYLKENRKSFSKVIVPFNDWMPLYYLFYTNDFNKKYIGHVPLEFRIPQIDNIFFVDRGCPSDAFVKLPKDVLIVDIGNCKEIDRYIKIGQLSRRDGTIAYRLLMSKEEK